MSQPSSNDELFMEQEDDATPMAPGAAPAPPTPQYRKQGFSVYTMMLILAFLASSAAAILLYVNVRG